MDAALLHPDALSAEDRAAWSHARQADARLRSPYLSLGFLDAVASVRPDTRVLRVSGESGPSFLPLQKGPFGHARALAGPLGDHHGIVGAALTRGELKAALRRAGVGVFDHHGALGAQSVFEGEIDGSWVCDLSGGYETFMRRRKKLGGNTARNIFAAERRVAEHGAVRFRFDDDRPEVLDQLIAWKSAQYHASGYFDVFSVAWTRSLLKTLLTRAADDGRGVLSSLEIDGRLVAAHFGLMGREAMHYWFPAYDPQWARQGPGNALLTLVLKALAERGVCELHLGPGEFRGKAALGCWQFALVRGCVEGGGPVAAVLRAAETLERNAEHWPLGPVSHWPGKAFRRIDTLAAFRLA